MCVVNINPDAFALLLDRGIGIGGVLRLIGLVQNGVRDLRGLGNELLLVGICVASSVHSKSL
jgi:hypothetical protein